MRGGTRNSCCSAGTHLAECWPTLYAVLMVLIGHNAFAASPEGVELFESKIRPIFVERCQKCHGSGKQESGLRLDSRKSALAGGDCGPAVVAGQPEDSELIKRITDPNDDVRMPPNKTGKR